MTKIGKIFIWILVLAVLFVLIYFLQRKPVEVILTDDEKVEDVDNNTNLEILGNKDDLLSFSIVPGFVAPKGILSYRGTIQGAYFFEANILINILDMNKNVLRASNAVATTDWMTAGPVDFEGNIDFTGLPAGPAYFEIHNDNASGLPENDKSILIPIVLQ